MQLIPAIDLRDGRVVRLRQGDDRQRTTYGLDPLEVLEFYAMAGVERVHVVDLDAAFGEPPQRPLVAALAAFETPRIQLGGGLRDAGSVAWALEAGCDRVVLGSLLVRDFDAFASLVEDFPGRVVPALEVKDGTLRIAGWREASETPLDALSGRLAGLPCPAVLVTDIGRDGTLADGPNLALARDLARRTGLPALVSGGVRALEDLHAASALPEVGGVIVGKALYDGVFTVEQALEASAGAAAGDAE